MVKNPPANVGHMRCGFDPWVGKMPWRKEWLLSGESHGQRSLEGYSPYSGKELDKTEET